MRHLTLHGTEHPTMDNKFILTENDAYFIHIALLQDENCPTFTDMIEKIWPIDSPAVFESVDKAIEDGEIIMGIIYNNTIQAEVPLGNSDFIQQRLLEVLGV